MNVTILDENAVFILRSTDRGARDVDAGDIGLHRLLIEDWRAAIAMQLDTRKLEQRVVLPIADERQHEIRGHVKRLVAPAQRHLRRRDLHRRGLKMSDDLPA